LQPQPPHRGVSSGVRCTAVALARPHRLRSAARADGEPAAIGPTSSKILKAPVGGRWLGSAAIMMRAEFACFLLLGLVVLPGRAAAAPGTFVEPEVEVLLMLEGERAGGLFGWALSAVADVDGDGASEVLTSAPFDTTGGNNAGRAYL